MDCNVHIVIVNYNSWRDTLECLESVLRNDYGEFKIIVVDNNSQDGSMDYMINWAEGRLDIWNDPGNVLYELSNPPIAKPIDYTFIDFRENKDFSSYQSSELIFIQSGQNNGFAAANNIAIKYAEQQNNYRYIWLLNNDAVIEADALSTLIKGVKGHSEVGVAGSKILYYSNPKRLQNVGSKIIKGSFFKLCKPIVNLTDYNEDIGQYDKPFYVDDLMGASMLITKDALHDVGIMPEEYFLYGEETDFNFNAAKHYYKLMTFPDSRVYHKKGSSTGGDDSALSIYYRTRNQFILYKKYMPILKYILYINAYVIKKLYGSYRFNSIQKQAIRKGLVHGIMRKFGRSKSLP